MWYVGLDGAYRKSGLVAFKDRETDPYIEELITTKAKRPEDALHELRVKFHKVIQRCQDRSRGSITMAIETNFNGPNAKTFKLLSMAYAVFLLAAFDHSARILKVHPSILKAFVCGPGTKWSKEDSIYVTKNRWRYDHSEEDVIDAYAFAQFARCTELGVAAGYKQWQAEICEPFNLELAASGQQ